ncbi:CAP domain-containing protein [Ramlibacter sp. AN1015]|uniref:CAP domain-containing protein n=1 Tax=Ramlibacter sp. AN1015 TaxID=3133428 RepID=UPI0030BF0BA6
MRLPAAAAAVLWGLALAVPASFAQKEPPGEEGLAQALAQARSQGCGGKQGLSAPLRTVPALSAAARRMAQGTGLQQALQQAGYRADRAFQIQLSGHSDVPAMVETVRQRYCEPLLNGQLSEVGIHRAGNATWIVLADPFSPPSQQQAPDVARRVLEGVNQARSEPRRCGNERFEAAAPLQLNPRLNEAAAAHAQDMARNNFMDHTGSQGSTVDQRVDRTGYDWRRVGENVAAGPQTAEAVVQGWLDSPGHCANIMQPAFTQMGVAFATERASQHGIYWAQVFATPR